MIWPRPSASTEQVVAYETGAVDVPADHLVKLCEYFEVSISYFFPATPASTE